MAREYKAPCYLNELCIPVSTVPNLSHVFGTDIINVQKHAQDTHLFACSYLTD